MLSKITWFFCVGLILYTSFVFHPQWKCEGNEATISFDVTGYYWYLPSVFIYKDLKHQSFADSIRNKYHNASEFPGFQSGNGNYVLKYSAGMACMYLPFFTVAHIFATLSHYPPDGFSPPYQLGIQIGGILIALLGLWYFRKLLGLFYNDKVVAIVLFVLVFGSNYLNFAALGTGMSHSWLFTIYVFLLLNTYYFYQKPSYKYAVRIGLLIGLATLARPTEIISLIIPLLWGLENFSLAGIKQKFAFLRINIKKIALAIICAFAVISIQLIYWKYVSGHWLVYSYGEQGFSWLRPHIKQYPFNYRSGWLTYTPMLIFAFIGIIPFLQKGKNKVAVLTFFLLNFYIVSAWDIWWYGGRAMIQSYVILMFPIAALVDVALRIRPLKWLIAPFFLLFAYFNLWVIYEEHLKGGLYDPYIMTKKYFWAVAGRFHILEEKKKLMDTDELFEGTPKNMKLLSFNNFENDTGTWCKLPPINGKRSVCINNEHPYSPASSVRGSLLANADWLRAEAMFYCPQKEWNVWIMPQFVVRFMYKGEKLKENCIRVDRFLDNGLTKDLYIDAEIPKQPFDSVMVFLGRGSEESQLPVLMDDLKIWSFNK